MSPRHPDRVVLLAGCLGLLAALPTAAAGPGISLTTLLDEMVDREASARFPAPAYTCSQASSYDRASVSPDQPDTWMANNDRSFFVRSENNGGREEWVLLDAKGPGCIVRFWATAQNAIGKLRFYLDGADEPVIDLPAQSLVGGDGLVGAPLSAVRARGMNLYLPIPYGRQCKITYDRPNFQATGDKDDLFYYQINYRTYEPGTQVESYSAAALQAAQPRIARLQQQLQDPAAALTGVNLRPPIALPLTTLAPGAARDLDLPAGPSAVRRLELRLRAANVPLATRSTILAIECDGQQTVWCPVGDFFGSGVGINPFRCWWREVRDDGTLICYWPMPYASSGKVRLWNVSDSQPVEVQLQVAVSDWTWDDRTMHFHANWRQEYPIDTSVKRDWNYLTAQGQGVYVGDTLALVNPVEQWWGEGDEKIYVDGEAFPSHFGTGTEDYYGYAWCTPQYFSSPFHGQPLAEGPRNQGHVTNTRVRLLDGIPFTRSFRMDMEVWHWKPVTVAYAVTTYWYGRPGAQGNHGAAPEQAKIFRPEKPPVPRVAGALEGESLSVRRKTGGETQAQNLAGHGWSGHEQLWWRDGQPGDQMVLEFSVAATGTYQLTANLTKAVDYGIVQLALDGQPLGSPLDLFQRRVSSRLYDFGTHQLTAGKHELSVAIVGANSQAVPRHMFGLDYLKLDRVP